MFGTIQLSNVAFGSHVISLTSAKESLAGVSSTLPETTSDSKVMKLYQEQFKELSALVITYASLLETDIALISQTGQELFHTDNVLGHALFSGLN